MWTQHLIFPSVNSNSRLFFLPTAVFFFCGIGSAGRGQIWLEMDPDIQYLACGKNVNQIGQLLEHHCFIFVFKTSYWKYFWRCSNSGGLKKNRHNSQDFRRINDDEESRANQGNEFKKEARKKKLKTNAADGPFKVQVLYFSVYNPSGLGSLT